MPPLKILNAHPLIHDWRWAKQDIPLFILWTYAKKKELGLEHLIFLPHITSLLSISAILRQSQAVERAVQELVNLLKSHLKEARKANLHDNYPCLTPDAKHKKQRCLECLPCSFYTMQGNFNQRNTDALIKCKFLCVKNNTRKTSNYITLSRL